MTSARRRGWQQFLFLALLIGAVTSAFSAPGKQDLKAIEHAMAQGRNQVLPCRALIEHDAEELLPCVRYRMDSKGSTREDEARRLGAYFFGWVTADSAAAFSVQGAAQAASAMLAEMLTLQQRLSVKDEQLCALMDVSCAQVRNRKREMLATQRKSGSAN